MRFQKSVILCGFMASGKTSVGTLLAEALDVPFYDTDRQIEKNSKLSIPEIFANEGEAAFRNYEYETAKSMALLPPGIISTGGGMLTSERNAKALASFGYIICLKRDFNLSYKILKNDATRPMVFGKSREEIFRLYRSRQSYYERFSDLTVDNSSTKKECVAAIIMVLAQNGILLPDE